MGHKHTHTRTHTDIFIPINLDTSVAQQLLCVYSHDYHPDQVLQESLVHLCVFHLLEKHAADIHTRTRTLPELRERVCPLRPTLLQHGGDLRGITQPRRIPRVHACTLPVGLPRQSPQSPFTYIDWAPDRRGLNLAPAFGWPPRTTYGLYEWYVRRICACVCVRACVCEDELSPSSHSQCASGRRSDFIHSSHYHREIRRDADAAGLIIQ